MTSPPAPDWALPLPADLLCRSEADATPAPSSRFRLGNPRCDEEPHYPGARPSGSFIEAGGLTYPVRPSDTGSGWAVLDGDWKEVDAWLTLRGLPTITARTAILAYGSNANPSQLSGLPEPRPVLALRGLLLGVAAAYCSSPRLDGQFPAGLAKTSASIGEEQFVLLVDAKTKESLDRKEGVGHGTYEFVGLDTGNGVDLILEDGTAWVGPLATYMQGHRRPLALTRSSQPVLLRDTSQRGFITLRESDQVTEHGIWRDPTPAAPPAATGLSVAPLPVFAYGTLRPGESRWPFVEPYVAFHRSDSVTGRRIDTGLGFPGLIPDAGAVTYGTLLAVRPESRGELMRLLDSIEGHPDLYRRELHRLHSGQLAWVYVWCGERADVEY